MEETQNENTNEISPENEKAKFFQRNRFAIISALILLVAVTAIFFAWSRHGTKTTAEKTEAKKEHHEEENEVTLSPENLEAAALQIESVTQRPAVARLKVTGTIELNQQETQEVTPLIGGRIERVNVALGDRVEKGQVLALILSPAIAQMRGKLHEAETKLSLSQKNLTRIKSSANRAAIISAKAKLDEAEATLRRTKKIVELGAGAGKDLIAAEASYKTAKADYDFQSNISLNRELQEAEAEVETSKIDLEHIKNELQALGADAVGENSSENMLSLVPLRAPLSGVITERKVNAGAGIESGVPLFSVSDLSTVYVIANVPEAQIGKLHIGTPADIRGGGLGEKSITGTINYIDPRLDENTRTARTRIEIPNPNQKLRAGMFVEVAFQTGTDETTGEELMIPSAAVQRLGERTIIFTPEENEPGLYRVKDVEVGVEIEGYRRVISGLELGEKVVTKGSFTLKTQLMKGELGEEH